MLRSSSSNPTRHSDSGTSAAHPEQARLCTHSPVIYSQSIESFVYLQVVQYLLANNYLLTALELLVEAQEAGNEEDVEGLQRFFSDQAKFPAEVVATYDPKDGMYHPSLHYMRSLFMTTCCPGNVMSAASLLPTVSWKRRLLTLAICCMQRSTCSSWLAKEKSSLVCWTTTCVLLKKIWQSSR